MPSNRAKKLIWDAHQAALKFARFADGRDFENFCEDDMFSSAVERQFTIIGEALAALRRSEPETAASIPDIDLIVGFRNVLVHGYDEFNKGIAWRTIEDDLPSLIEMLAGMLADDESA